MIILKVIYEAIVQALDSMRGNKLRTFLSLLGITIGIFCIIAVKSAVDSLQENIMAGFNELGSDVLYLDKSPWNEDPGQNYWKYLKRPDPTIKDYEAIKEKAKLVQTASYTIFTGGRTIKFNNSAVSNAFIVGATLEYGDIQSIEFGSGRYFTRQEYESANNKVILGAKVADELFNIVDPVGQKVKLFGQDFSVIGVLKEEGQNEFNFINFDEAIWIPYTTATKFINTGDNSPVQKLLAAKTVNGADLEEVKGEITGIIRNNRRLAPSEDNNFAINEISMLSQIIDQVFGVMNFAGFLIGIFSLIVGMFSVANIMFVSVKERTSIIGIKKALGAKRFVILLEFLIEAVILCLLGGLIGLVLVYVVLKGISSIAPFAMSLSFGNLLIGLLASVLVGIISGVVPAMRASKLDPVVAMRS